MKLDTRSTLDETPARAGPRHAGLGRVATLAACLALVALAAAAASEPPKRLEGVVARVIDGDSLVLRTRAGDSVDLRLAEIDAPELDQPYGLDSKRALARQVSGRRASATVVDVDRYGRSVVDLEVDGVDVNAAMVGGGHAWAYTRYARGVRMIELEDRARAASRGLWALPPEQRDPPWAWRRRGRENAAAPPGPPMAREDVRCGEKTRCAEMSSCAEARAHLEHCGAKLLDGDGDGIPCEAICR